MYYTSRAFSILPIIRQNICRVPLALSNVGIKLNESKRAYFIYGVFLINYVKVGVFLFMACFTYKSVKADKFVKRINFGIISFIMFRSCGSSHDYLHACKFIYKFHPTLKKKVTNLLFILFFFYNDVSSYNLFRIV